MALDTKQKVELATALRLIVWALDLANRNQLTQAEIEAMRTVVTWLARSLED